MNNKRPLIPDIYKQRKKLCVSEQNDEGSSTSATTNNKEMCQKTKDVLTRLQSGFPVEKFQGRVPAIILKHQLYSLIENRTHVDKELSEMRLLGEIRLFRLGIDSDDLCVMFTCDYTKHVQRMNPNVAAVDKFINSVIPQCTDISVNRETLLNQYGFREEDITDLMKAGVLTLRDVGSWWLAIPGAGEFMKCYIRGRKAILLMIKKCKYSEIYQKDLESRKLPKMAKLGMLYHIYDIVGAELVKITYPSSGGKILHLNE